MTRETAWKRWRRGTPMHELATQLGVPLIEIEEMIRKKLIARDNKRRRRAAAQRKSNRGAAKQRRQS